MSVSVQLGQVGGQAYSKETFVPPKTQVSLEGICPTPFEQIKGFSPLDQIKLEFSSMVTATLSTVTFSSYLPSSAVLASIFMICYLEQRKFSDFLLSRRYLPTDFKKPAQQPLIVFKDISATDWEASLHYSKNEIEVLSGKFLAEFKIEANQKNKTWLLNMAANIISLYESQYHVELSEKQREALRNLALQMAYDRLRTE
jgi:hypothetical protein